MSVAKTAHLTIRGLGRMGTMVVTLARKLLIALWRLATQGVVPDGAALKPAA